MIVLGGTYEEICRDPASIDLIGSGQRAAAVLRSVVADELELITAVDDDTLSDAETLAQGGGVPLRVVERSEPVRFIYATPLSAPIVSGARATISGEIEADADVALAFGMLETRVRARARRLVFDPQQPQDLTPLSLGPVEADHLALVANAAETQALAGGSRSLEEAAQQLLAGSAAEVLITKAGARGALVTTGDAQEWIGPHPTPEVWPIGSGDVFAAGFAWAWGKEEADPVEAARAGSMAAAHWCKSQRLNLPAEAFKISPSSELAPRQGRVYLAGPFFNVAERWLIELVNESMRSLGGFVFSPLHDVGRGHDIAAQDIAGLEDCTAMLALLDYCDPGTMFEVGWARKFDIPVIGLSQQLDLEAMKMLSGTGVVIREDLSSAVYQALWASMGASVVG
ncbi:MAG TPA: PfkB family carbohydrate kinase [Solirubrobacterales bacterium]|nr:PfkB family carbohydrate kinase [Solirubrobacterales bacterium]